MTIRVCIVEDDALTRTSLAKSLESAGLEVVMSSASASEAVRLSENEVIDVAILDLHLGPGPTGIDVAKKMRSRNPALGIVFLTSFENPKLLSSNHGSIPANSSYLVKSAISDVEQLVEAVTIAASGRSIKTRETESVGNLPTTQIETLKLVADGLSNLEIAKLRFVTERSVETTIYRAAKALGLDKDKATNQRVQLAKLFLRASGQVRSD
jgi:two-component system, NarL family, nitrate/nitrite response regulator NarL